MRAISPSGCSAPRADTALSADRAQEPAIPYGERPHRYLIHGGGWGWAPTRSKIPALEAAGLDS